jgi:hypothetical protein
MTNLTAQFDDVLRRLSDEAAAPEVTPVLFPVRVARACAQVLPAAGVGLALFEAENVRFPIGASSDTAADAERLQFTTGEGPCLQAHHDRRPVIATEAELARRWPLFHDQLLAVSPFRAVVAVPLRRGLNGLGTMDLYFRQDVDIEELELTDLEHLVDHVSQLLLLSTASSPEFPTTHITSSDTPRETWLDVSPTSGRNAVFIATGMLNISLRLSAPDALALLRAYAFGAGRTVDDVAADIMHRRLPLETLEY